jgi:catechol 2,3-dioxygenase
MVERLAHVVLFVGDLDLAEKFYCDVLGMVRTSRTSNALYLRGYGEYDSWTLGLVVDPSYPKGLHHLSLKVTKGSSLWENLASEASRNIQASAGTGRKDRELECFEGNIRITSPEGFPLEFIDKVTEVEWLRATDDLEVPVHPRRRAKGNRGLWRLDHVNLRVPDVGEALVFWRDKLGFSVSEWVRDGDKVWAAWLRRRRVSHDVALAWSQAWAGNGVSLPEVGFHHVAFLVETPQDLLLFADRLADWGYPDLIEFGPGRHGISDAYFLYIRDPFGNRIELFCLDYERDLESPPIEWSPAAYKKRGLLWWGKSPPIEWREILPVNLNWVGREGRETLNSRGEKGGEKV